MLDRRHQGVEEGKQSRTINMSCLQEGSIDEERLAPTAYLHSERTTAQAVAGAGWNLMNEPRNEHSNGTAEMQDWITTMAAHVKRLAPNQLVTIGQDGFYGRSNCMSEM